MKDIASNIREYVHRLREEFSKGERIDMTETLYYATALPLHDGKAEGSFYISDLVTTFRISAHSFDKDGRIGESITTISSAR